MIVEDKKKMLPIEVVSFSQFVEMVEGSKKGSLTKKRKTVDTFKSKITIDSDLIDAVKNIS